MRKISKSRSAFDEPYLVDDNGSDALPGRIQGATITSWHGSPEIDLDALFAKSSNGATVAGSAPASTNYLEQGTVALSDGTRITFTNPNQFKAVVTV